MSWPGLDGLGGGRLRLYWLVGDLSVVETLRSLNICVCAVWWGDSRARPAQLGHRTDTRSERKSLNKNRNRTGDTDPLPLTGLWTDMSIDNTEQSTVSLDRGYYEQNWTWLVFKVVTNSRNQMTIAGHDRLHWKSFVSVEQKL